MKTIIFVANITDYLLYKKIKLDNDFATNRSGFFTVFLLYLLKEAVLYV